jgi:hypothetical protein
MPLSPDVVGPVGAYLALGQLDDQAGLEQGRVLGGPADHHVLRRLEVDRRRRDLLAERALDDDRPPRVVDVGDARVRGAEIDSEGHGSSRGMGVTGRHRPW